MDDEGLVKIAMKAIRPRKTRHGNVIGDVGCALLSGKGRIYTGACLDICCGIGFCAEHSAIAAMVTAGEERIMKIVAVAEHGIITPCGRCRELMCQLDEKNLDTEVITAKDRSVRLRDLLPERWDG